MSVRSILLFAPAESADPGAGAAAWAIGLARAHGAALTIMTFALDVTTPGRDVDAGAMATRLSEAATAAGVSAELVTEHSHAIGVHEAVAAEARLHDLAVLGCSSGGLISERIVAEHLLFASGRPVVIVPAQHRAAPAHGRIAAAWDDTAGAARALADATLLLAPGEATLLTVEGEKPLPPAIATDRVVATLARRGAALTAATRALGQRSIGEALQAEAAALGADMLVMGAFGHSRLRRFILGSATGGIMAQPTMPVLFSH